MVKASAGSVRPDSVDVEFGDERLIANAGLLMVATLSRRLGVVTHDVVPARQDELRAADDQGSRVCV